MFYDYHDAAMDEAYERLSEELYLGHKAQAVIEFTCERLRSYYLKHKDLLVPAARTYKAAESLLQDKQSAAALVFSASAIEAFIAMTANPMFEPTALGKSWAAVQHERYV